MESEVVEGDRADHRTAIVEFENRESLRAWYDSPAYLEVLALRLQSVPGALAVVDGFVPPSD